MPLEPDATIDIGLIIKRLHKNILGHMLRVSRSVDVLSRCIQCSCQNFCPAREDELAYYGEASFYHDIGKAYIPLGIITKPNTFTGEEAFVMKQHPLCAEVLFRDIDSGLITGIPKHLEASAYNAAVFHHEWWNGSGYPYGICRGEIPLIARITSVCDAYDAMTSNRVYRKARSHNDACLELKKFSGTQFDPEIVRVFLSVESEISAIIRSCEEL